MNTAVILAALFSIMATFVAVVVMIKEYTINDKYTEMKAEIDRLKKEVDELKQKLK